MSFGKQKKQERNRKKRAKLSFEERLELIDDDQPIVVNINGRDFCFPARYFKTNGL